MAKNIKRRDKITVSSKGQHISDQTPYGKYFTQVPNMAIEELNPYQLALYMQYKRICSLKNGVTFMSNKKLAESAGMSLRKLQSTRKELEELGYIQVTPQYDESGNINKSPHVIVLNIMAENIQYWDNIYKTHAPDAHPHAPDAHPHAPDAPKEYINKNRELKRKTLPPKKGGIESLPKSDTDSKPDTIDAKENAYQLSLVIPELLGMHNGREWNVAHMLSGTSKANGYKQYASYFTGDNMVSPDELKAVVAFYRKQHPDAPMIQSPQIISDWVGKYRASEESKPKLSQSDIAKINAPYIPQVVPRDDDMLTEDDMRGVS